MIYKFKDAAHFRASFDQKAGAARLGELLDRDGDLAIDAIIADGIQEDSPLHPQFTMDADEALRATWEREADYLRRSFVVVHVLPNGKEHEIRAVVPVVTREDADQHHFISTIVALSDDDYRRQVLRRALDDLTAWRRKYDELDELARVFAVIDSTAKRFKKAA